MTEWLVFEGEVIPLQWGRATYTILPLPDEITAALEAAGARRVEGEIAEHPVNLALSRAPVHDGAFLWAGRSLLERIGIELGERVEIRLRPADAGTVETPEDVTAALRSSGLTAAWEALSPGRRRGLLYRVESARTASTRSRRIAALAAGIEGGA